MTIWTLSELEGLAVVAAQFYDMLAGVRPELGQQSVSARKQIRERYIVDAAVMMHGYAAIMRDFNDDLARLGTSKARTEWAEKLKKLSGEIQYSFNGWGGDLFEKRNPLWTAIGVVKPSQDRGRLTVLNTGAARSGCGRVLRQLMSLRNATTDLRFLAQN